MREADDYSSRWALMINARIRQKIGRHKSLLNEYDENMESGRPIYIVEYSVYSTIFILYSESMT
ncbi:Protein of unknown function [Gryllus bimaculatus]|nr:Protein of unknown function [Gryllus bimaculatus]